jgi:uncharacterized membrane protein
VKRYAIWAAALLVLMCLTMWLTRHTETMLIHEDELLSYVFTAYPFDVVARMERDTHLPLWWLQFWVWWRMVGETEFAGRWNSILILMITLAMLYQVGRVWFKSPLIGMGGMALFAIHPYALNHALDIRPYTLSLLTALLSTWFLWRWLQQPTARRARIYGVAVAVMLYTHYYLAALAVAQGIFALLARRQRACWGQMAQAFALVLAAWGLWLPVMLRHIEHLRRVTRPLDARDTLSPSPTLITSPETFSHFLDLNTAGFWVLLLAGALAGLALGRHRLALLLGLTIFLLPTSAVLLANTRVSLFTERYMVFVLWGAILTAMAVWAVFRPAWLRAGAVGVTLVGVALYSPLWQKPHPPVRTVYQTLAQSLLEGDAIVLDVVRNVPLAPEYYVPREYPLPVPITPEEVHQYGRFWHVSDNLYDAAIFQRFEAMRQQYEIQAVIGECDTSRCFIAHLFQAPPKPE